MANDNSSTPVGKERLPLAPHVDEIRDLTILGKLKVKVMRSHYNSDLGHTTMVGLHGYDGKCEKMSIDLDDGELVVKLRFKL